MKTVIYNIGTLAGILPQGVLKLEGEQMGNVECLHDAYLVIEDGIITEFGSGWKDREFQNRATPLAAGGGAHEVGGVVLKTVPISTARAEVCDDSVLNDKTRVLDALHMIHLRTLEPHHSFRQNTSQPAYIIYNCLHI